MAAAEQESRGRGSSLMGTDESRSWWTADEVAKRKRRHLQVQWPQLQRWCSDQQQPTQVCFSAQQPPQSWLLVPLQQSHSSESDRAELCRSQLCGCRPRRLSQKQIHSPTTSCD